MRLERSRPEDAVEMAKWMSLNLPLNDCSLRDLKGCTWWKIAGILYLPIKPVLLLESLAPNPSVTGKKRLLALRRAMDDLRKLYPHVEILFLTRSNTKLRDAAKRYGFEEAPFVVMRLNDAEKARKRAQASKGRSSEARLRNHSGAGGRAHLEATRDVSCV